MNLLKPATKAQAEKDYLQKAEDCLEIILSSWDVKNELSKRLFLEKEGLKK
jgi:hypothetical protein